MCRSWDAVYQFVAHRTLIVIIAVGFGSFCASFRLTILNCAGGCDPRVSVYSSAAAKVEAL